MKENIPYLYRPITSKVSAKFLWKVTWEKQVRGKKKHLSINKISFDSFSFEFHHFGLCFEALCHYYANNENKHEQH